MEFRKLGALEVSTIGLGTLNTFNVTSGEDIAVRRRIVDCCLSEGINFIDSAAAYGDSEMVVGKAVRGRRDKFYLATKVRVQGKEAGEAQIAQSFRSFQTDYIDVYYAHRHSPEIPLDETYAKMRNEVIAAEMLRDEFG